MKNPHAIEDAVAAAKASNVAILFLGLGNEMEAEGNDRTSLALPDDQIRLLQKVVAANPKTVVVLTGGGLITAPWLSKVSALMHGWYPGSEGGRALARLLVGQANPSGKLPLSYLKRLEDSSAYGRYPGTNHRVSYSEGIYVGYRFLDQNQIAPLFSFGFGLSYTTFAIRNLQTQTLNSSTYDPKVRITFDVTNTGSREGAEVARVYVGERNPKLDRAPRELKNFARVSLKSGETKTVSLDLSKSAFAYYNEQIHGWTVDPNLFDISVGASSSDLALTGQVRLEP